MRFMMLVAAITLLSSTPTEDGTLAKGPAPQVQKVDASVPDAGSPEADLKKASEAVLNTLIVGRRVQMLEYAKVYTQAADTLLVGVYFSTEPTADRDAAIVVMDHKGTLVMNVFFFVEKKSGDHAWSVVPMDFRAIEVVSTKKTTPTP